MDLYPNNLKRAWIFPPIVFCACLLVCGLGATGCSSSNNDADSKAYVDKIAPVIFKNWDPNAILVEAGPDLKEQVSRYSVEKWWVSSMKDQLGSLKTIKSCTEFGKAQDYGLGYPTAQYYVDGDFEKGGVTIIVTVDTKGGGWKVDDLSLVPTAGESAAAAASFYSKDKP